MKGWYNNEGETSEKRSGVLGIFNTFSNAFLVNHLIRSGSMMVRFNTWRGTTVAVIGSIVGSDFNALQ